MAPVQIERHDIGNGVFNRYRDDVRPHACLLTRQPAPAAVNDLAVHLFDGDLQAVLLDVLGQFVEVLVIKRKDVCGFVELH